MFKLVLTVGGAICMLIIWLFVSSTQQYLNTEKRLSHLHHLFHQVQQTYAVAAQQPQRISEYKVALQSFLGTLVENKSLLTGSLDEASLAWLNDLRVDASIKDEALLQQHERLVQAFLALPNSASTSAWQNNLKWWSLLVMAMILWGALLYCLYRKLAYSIVLTQQVLMAAKGAQSYQLPEALSGQLAAEQELTELLKFIDVLATRLDEVHSRFIEEAQEATLGSMTQGFSKSLLKTVEHAATHQKRLTTIMNKLDSGQVNDEQITQLHTKSRQILNQLDEELANVYELLADFEQISNYHQFDIEVEFNLKTLVEGVFARHHQELAVEQFHVSYEIPDNLKLNSAPAVFEQIYHHCISNSVKHAKSNDRVLHIVVSAMVVNDYVHLYFKDDGVGIDSELLPILAEPTLNSRQHFGKHGLGLSVIHHLVRDKLHGEFKIQSPAHGGACIHIVLEKTHFELDVSGSKGNHRKQNAKNPL